VIVEQITIRNWRGYRQPHTFRFQDGINLLVGRNEAGKSTLFEALTRVLFDRHNSRTEEIRAIQPLGSTLGPEAEVQFRANGRRYRAVKRFLESPRSELYSERGGRWELDHEGDEADARLREILRGEAAARTAARPEHRGLAQALWYLQSDGAIPEKAWSDGVKQGLQGLVQLAASSPLEKDLLERLHARYAEYWTPTGRVASNSELAELLSSLPRLEERLADLQAKAKIVESHRAELEEIQSSEAEKRKALEKAQAELSELSLRVQEAEALEKEREAKERAKHEAVQKAQRLKQDLAQVEDKQKKINARRAEAKRLEDSLAEAAADAKAEAAARDRHARRWKEELEPALQAVEAELRCLAALDRLRQREKDRNRLEQHLRKVAYLAQQLDARKKERAELVAPSDKEWKQFVAASKELSVLQAQVEASAVRVSFEWTGKARKVETRPTARVSEQGEYLVAEPTEFEIDGVGKIRVRSGAAALKDLLAKRDRVDQEVQQFLRRFGVSDADGMAALHQRGRDLDKVIAELEESLAETRESEPQAEEELARIERDIEEEKRTASPLPPEVQEWGGQKIRDQIAEKEREKRRLVREIGEEQKAEKAAASKHLELVEAREAASTKVAALKAEIETHQEGIAAILANYGTLEQLRALVTAAEEEVRSKDEELAAFLAEYEEKVEMPRRLYEQAQQRVRELDKQLVELRTRAAATLARIEEAAAQGNYSQLADTEIEVAWRKRRLGVLRRRAEGAKLLRELVSAHEQQRSAALSGPIQELVNRWLQLLTEGNYYGLQIDHDLKPTAVHLAGYGAELPLSSLSHGAQEQVVVLLRLAIAVLVSKDERNLVVIDDRLVNADPVRMKRLCLILQEAAKSCQVVIATCNDTPYAGLGAHTVRVPADGNRALASAE
jgi:DNA repair exonuclease SbcCD ATPase subunit